VLGLGQVAGWGSGDGRAVALDAGRAALELFDDAQAGVVDAIEAGCRVSGAVRLAVRVAGSAGAARRLVAVGAAPAAAGDRAVGRPQRPGPGTWRDAADPVHG
jgi:methylmalonyl-CoA/ethylmalonyl-CoA epimerase